jgi:hypothetical protein
MTRTELIDLFEINLVDFENVSTSEIKVSIVKIKNKTKSFRVNISFNLDSRKETFDFIFIKDIINRLQYIQNMLETKFVCSYNGSGIPHQYIQFNKRSFNSSFVVDFTLRT